ncbi:hypothetical protein G4O51_04275 [Candidatus Bathyarchaeota archaeon A05DMB-2]|nr:hypothetical protein [Candidatus Bathyarchaeota archaeon A05DMB-2]
MKILLHGYFGYGNLGDEAICKVLIDKLATKGTEVIVLSTDPKRTSKLHGVKSYHEKIASFAFVKNLLTSRVLIFAGGGRYGLPTLRRMCIIALLAKLFAKKVVFQSVGIYPNPWFYTKINPKSLTTNLVSRMMLILAFGLSDRISVRDKFSEQVLRLTGIRKHVRIVEDLALQLKPSSLENASVILSEKYLPNPKKDNLLIGVNLRTLEPDINEKLNQVLPAVLDWIVDNFKATLIFIPFGLGSIGQRFWDDDRTIGREIRQGMKHKESFIIIEKEYKPEDVLGLFRLFDLFIGMRYHSIVFSEIMGVPHVAIVYDTKVEEFIGDRNNTESGIWLSDLDEGRLKEMLEETLKLHKLVE